MNCLPRAGRISRADGFPRVPHRAPVLPYRAVVLPRAVPCIFRDGGSCVLDSAAALGVPVHGGACVRVIPRSGREYPKYTPPEFSASADSFPPGFPASADSSPTDFSTSADSSPTDSSASADSSPEDSRDAPYPLNFPPPTPPGFPEPPAAPPQYSAPEAAGDPAPVSAGRPGAPV